MPQSQLLLRIDTPFRGEWLGTTTDVLIRDFE
jgi:hypothetical protein